MDTLKGLIYLETAGDKIRWCVAVEDPSDSLKTRIIKRKEHIIFKKISTIRSHKRNGYGRKFRAFRFNENLSDYCTVDLPIQHIFSGFSEKTYQSIPITELEKLYMWKLM